MPALVFLSSTRAGLEAHREAAFRAIQRVEGCRCVRMEDFAADPRPSAEVCRERVARCDLFVGLVGPLYGSSPDDDPRSFTEIEHDAAVEAGRPCLVFMTPEDFEYPANLAEADARRQAQASLRARLRRASTVAEFSTAEELEVKVLQAVYEWLSGRPALPGAAPAAPRPLAHRFVHPYPLQEHFTGRGHERRALTCWLATGTQPVLALVAMGGMGKSALAWAWVQRDVLVLPLPGVDDPPGAGARPLAAERRPEGVLWWSFYERQASFPSFLDEALAWASGGEVDPRRVASAHEKVRALLDRLARRRVLLVLDGFERELRAYARLGAAWQGDEVPFDPEEARSCSDPHAANLLRWAAALPLAGRLLLTTRLLPRELDGLAGCRREDLEAMEPDDAVAFFRAHGVRGTRREVLSAGRRFGFHPLALRLLVGLVMNHPARPGDLGAVRERSSWPKVAARLDRILSLAYEALAPDDRKLLCRLAAFRSPVGWDSIAVLSPFATEPELEEGLERLRQRQLVLFDRERARFDLHPVVRGWAYGQLLDREAVHERLASHFRPFADGVVPGGTRGRDIELRAVTSALAQLAMRRVESLEDLAPVVELYHHTVGAGRYDDAWELFRDRLYELLTYRFGAHRTSIELLSALVGEGGAAEPRLAEARARAGALNDLGNSYSLAGEPRRALPLLAKAVELGCGALDRGPSAVALLNLALNHFYLGELAAAAAALARALAECEEADDRFHHAIATLETGRLLACRSEAEAARRLLAAGDAALAALPGVGQARSLAQAYLAGAALLAGEPEAAEEAARTAVELAGEGYARDEVRARWLLGSALVARAAGEPERREPLLAEAGTEIAAGLELCRRIDAAFHESNLLLASARWHRLGGRPEPARADVEQALAIADRCEYRLNQAEAHELLAQLALAAGGLAEARRHAEAAHARARCDGPPHEYRPLREAAERLLAELAPSSPTRPASRSRGPSAPRGGPG